MLLLYQYQHKVIQLQLEAQDPQEIIQTEEKEIIQFFQVLHQLVVEEEYPEMGKVEQDLMDNLEDLEEEWDQLDHLQDVKVLEINHLLVPLKEILEDLQEIQGIMLLDQVVEEPRKQHLIVVEHQLQEARHTLLVVQW